MSRGVRVSIGSLLKMSYNILKENRIDSYIIDSQLLLAYTLKRDRLYILLNVDKELNKEDEDKFFKLVDMRKNKMPIKYIIKSCEFMGIDFYINEGVLIPRPDTEILVETVLREILENKYEDVLDLCCGSGIIGLSIARFAKNVDVTLSDISDRAIEVTGKNILRLKLSSAKVLKCDLLSRFVEKNKKFDVIVSNPPYIETAEIDSLMEDVKDYEPMLALDGGDDGLIFYRRIIDDAVKVLNIGGLIAFEIGYNQKNRVKEELKKKCFVNIKAYKDLAGKDRVITAKFLGY